MPARLHRRQWQQITAAHVELHWSKGEYILWRENWKLCGNCVGTTMGFANGKGKGTVTDWTDLTGESDEEPTGTQMQVVALGPTAYDRASASGVAGVALSARTCSVCGDILESTNRYATGTSGLSSTCTVCTNLDAMFPTYAQARQQHREHFPGGRPPGMPPLMPAQEPRQIRKKLREAALKAETLRVHARAAATSEAAGKTLWPFINWKPKNVWLHWAQPI